MTKFGIIGSNKELFKLSGIINTIPECELTGIYQDDHFNSKDAAQANGLLPYSTLESLFRYTDVIVINYDVVKDVSLIEKCLKHFKHVFLMGAQALNYTDFIRLEKISEESNVKLYPEFGSDAAVINEITGPMTDLQFVDIRHSFPVCKDICMSDGFTSALIKDLDMVTSRVNGNLKKLNTSGWDFNEPGCGLLSVRIDMDNGTSINMLLTNSGCTEKFFETLYRRSEVVKIAIENNDIKINKEPISGVPVNVSESKWSSGSIFSELKLFLSASMQEPSGLRALSNKYNSIRIFYLVHEKIIQFSSQNIFYS